jgi:hypothetical protein
VIKTVRQGPQYKTDPAKNGMIQISKTLWHRGGVQSFFSGATVRLLRVTPVKNQKKNQLFSLYIFLK